MKETTAFWLLVVLIVFTVSTISYVVINDSKAWGKFSKENNCVIVGKNRGSVQTGLGHGVTMSGKVGVGVVTTISPSKTAWLCDDGVTYWR